MTFELGLPLGSKVQDVWVSPYIYLHLFIFTMQHEIMYNQSSVVIVVVLFLVILLAYEICFQSPHREVKVQANAVQAGVLGLLALLLGFTFNMALQRFDNRSNAVINEANAIGTA
jgi:hypothetical protein